MLSPTSVAKFKTALGLMQEIFDEQQAIAAKVREVNAEDGEDADEERMEDVADERQLAVVPIPPRPMEVEHPGTREFFKKYQYALVRASTWSSAEKKRLDAFVQDVRALIEGLGDPDPITESSATISGGVIQRDLLQLRKAEWKTMEARWRSIVESAAERVGIPYSLLRLISPKALVAVPGFGEQLIHVGRHHHSLHDRVRCALSSDGRCSR